MAWIIILLGVFLIFASMNSSWIEGMDGVDLSHDLPRSEVLEAVEEALQDLAEEFLEPPGES